MANKEAPRHRGIDQNQLPSHPNVIDDSAVPVRTAAEIAAAQKETQYNLLDALISSGLTPAEMAELMAARKSQG